MADFRRVTDNFYVAPQILGADIPEAAARGFKTLIVNRPDGEDPGQMTMAQSQAAAEAAGMTFLAIPIRGAPAPEAVAQTSAAIAASTGPVLAYCRSGTRSVTLWAFATAQAGTMPTAAIMLAAQAAGYDLSAHAPALEAARA
jgi:uncharacterized protein (TIGR01244 family)